MQSDGTTHHITSHHIGEFEGQSQATTFYLSESFFYIKIRGSKLKSSVPSRTLRRTTTFQKA
jgi:hypothetical protein